MLKQYSDTLTIKELCKELGIERHKAYRMIKSGKLKSIRIGNSYKIPKQYYQEYLYSQSDKNSKKNVSDGGTE